MTKIKTQAISPEAWTSFTPTFTNLTIGNGTLVAAYIQIGKTVHFRIKLTLGSTSSFAGGGVTVRFTLPVTANSVYSTVQDVFGRGVAVVAGSSKYDLIWNCIDTTHAQLQVLNASGTYLTVTGTSDTVPGTWTTGDVLTCSGTYEAA